VEELGRGAFGVVYKAHDDQLDCLVALKVLRPKFAASPADRTRFEGEARKAAAVRDDHVVAIHRVGSTPGFPLPYFVMEYLDGGSLTERLERHTVLGPREAAEVVRQAALGLAAAHARGLVHRDVKPGNVLLEGDSGRAKISDFGLARELNPDRTRVTRSGVILGTPPYMSPEQIATPERVGPLSDVYSLGAVLYELLTGRPPFHGATDLDTLRQVVAEEPPPPRRLRADLPRDLETVCLKCLQKEPARRYPSARLLAEDLQRWLNGESIHARPVGLLGRGWRWGRRNRLVAGLAATLVLVVAGSLVALAALWLQARAAVDAEGRAKGQAQRRLQQIETGIEVLASVFRNLDPKAEEKEGKALRVLLGERLEKAARQLEGEAVGDPLAVARLQDLLGTSLRALGHLDKAETVLQKALDTRAQLLGADDPDTLTSMSNLGALYLARGRYDEAEPLCQQALEGRRRTLGPDHPDTLQSMSNLADLNLARGRYDKAEPLYQQALEGHRRTRGADHPDTLASMSNLAALYHECGRYKDAEELLQQALEGHRRTRGADHPDTLGIMNNLVVLYSARGRYKDAKDLLQEVLEAQRRTLGADHPDTLTTMHNLAALYHNSGQYDEAETRYKQVLEASRLKLGPGHALTLVIMYNLARLHQAQDRYADAEARLSEAIPEARKTLGLGHPYTQSFIGSWSEVQAKLGKPERAEPLLRELGAFVRVEPGPDSPKYATALALLAANLLAQHKYREAEGVACTCLAIGEQKQPQEWTTSLARSLLGAALLGQKKYAAAEPLLVQGYQGLKERQDKLPPPSKERVPEALERLVRLYHAWGKPDEEDKWRKELEAARAALPGAKKP
jgi:tetratricopeptide (TPR) repeat protein